MQQLTEAEVIARLRDKISAFPSMTVFAHAHNVCQPNITAALKGTYNKGKSGLPPSVLAAIRVRKRWIHEMIRFEVKRRWVYEAI
jgi:hypothetical protein